MKKMLCMAMACLMVAGCSSNSQGNGEANTENKDTFTVGMECNYAPMNWTEQDATDLNYPASAGGYCDGYDVQISKLIAEDLGKELVIKKIAWDGLEMALNSGEIDAIIAGMSKTPERAENADFTTSYWESEMVMIVNSDGDLADASALEDFSGRNVLGQLGTLYDSVIDQIPEVNHLIPRDDYPTMIMALKSGEADALTAESQVGMGYVNSDDSLSLVYFDEGKGFEMSSDESAVAIAVKKGNTDLLNDVQAALDKIDAQTREELMNASTSRQPSSN